MTPILAIFNNDYPSRQYVMIVAFSVVKYGENDSPVAIFYDNATGIFGWGFLEAFTRLP